MIDVYLADVHVTCMWVGFRCSRREEKLLHSKPDKQNPNYSNDMVLAHGKPPSLTAVL